MVNVPSAVWIDEEGRIVRPPEPAAVTEAFKAVDLASFSLPPDAVETGFGPGFPQIAERPLFLFVIGNRVATRRTHPHAHHAPSNDRAGAPLSAGVSRPRSRDSTAKSYRGRALRERRPSPRPSPSAG